MWANLVLDIIINYCRTPNEVKDAISTLPTSLEKLYLDCLERKRDSQPPCDPRPIMVVCAVPRPLQIDALRQLLALDMSKGNYSPDDMLSSDAVIQHSVGLITLDKDEQLVLPAHDSVRKFIFSEAARVAIHRLMRFHKFSTCAFSMPVPDSRIIVKHGETQASTWEAQTRTHIGRACLVHMQQRGLRTTDTSFSQQQVAIPTPTTSMPFSVQKLSRTRLSRALLPRSLDMISVPANILSPMHKAPAQRSDFLGYAMNNWLDCNHHLSLQSEAGKLFSRIAMERDQRWNTPWSTPTIGSHMLSSQMIKNINGDSVVTDYQLERMFAYSVTNGHLPLLKLTLEQKHLPKSIWKGILGVYKNLPALHLACRLGHDRLLPDLGRIGDVFATSHMSKTALHYAAEAGHLNCVKQIIQMSNDHEKAFGTETFYVDEEDSESRTALHLAVMNGHEDVALFLVKVQGAKVTSAGPKGFSAIDLAWKHGHGHVLKSILELSDQTHLAILQALDKDGRSQLILAAMAGETNRVEVLCSLCEVNATDLGGMTAFAHASQRGHESVVRVLLRSVHFSLETELRTESRGNTALAVAAEGGHANVVRFLLDNGFIVQMVMERFAAMPRLPIEAVVLRHYRLRLHSLKTARAILGTMVTSLQTLQSMAITGNLKVPFTSSGLLTQKARELRTLDIFLRAAAEIGHVDAVRHLLELRETEPYRTQTVGSDRDLFLYLSGLGVGIESLDDVGIRVRAQEESDQATPFPIPVFLAAVRQHEEVLALLLPGQHTFIQDLMEIARDIHLDGRASAL
jgi:ankyrin repeat protein